MSVLLILAVIALILAVCSLVPNLPRDPILSVAVLLLAIAFIVMGR